MSEYADRDHMALGDHYVRHVSAMTAEGLHRKSDIAAELAWRDAEIERLRAQVAALSAPAPAPAEPVAWRVQLDGLWFHAKDRDGLIAAIGVKLGRSVAAKYMQPLYTAPAAPAAAPAPAELPHQHEGDTALAVGNLIYALESWKGSPLKNSRPAWDALVKACRELAEAAAPAAHAGWQPIETAPKDGSSFLVPPDAGYTHCFWQDGIWWWHTVHSSEDGDYAAGPKPKGWAPAAPGAQGDA